MTPNKNRRPARERWDGKGYDNGKWNAANVIHLPISNKVAASPFDALTYKAVMAQHAAGELPPTVVSALLIGCGVQP
jgi:hypothetical protein